jgi:hypothetical protein
VGLCRSVLVALLFHDFERFEIPLLRRGEVVLMVGDHSQLVVGTCLPLRVNSDVMLRQTPEEPFGLREVAAVPGEKGRGRLNEGRGELNPQAPAVCEAETLVEGLHGLFCRPPRPRSINTEIVDQRVTEYGALLQVFPCVSVPKSYGL